MNREFKSHTIKQDSEVKKKIPRFFVVTEGQTHRKKNSISTLTPRERYTFDIDLQRWTGKKIQTLT